MAAACLLSTVAGHSCLTSSKQPTPANVHVHSVCALCPAASDAFPLCSPDVVPDTGTICMGPAVVDVLVAVEFSGGMSGSLP